MISMRFVPRGSRTAARSTYSAGGVAVTKTDTVPLDVTVSGTGVVVSVIKLDSVIVVGSGSVVVIVTLSVKVDAGGVSVIEIVLV